MPCSPLVPPSLPPLRARLLNALIARGLPVACMADAGTATAPRCLLDVDGTAAANHPAPFAVAATLFFLTGDVLWKLECSSLAALALRPELAAWREGGDATGGNDFSMLPPGLRVAVLERLFGPALEKAAAWFGCEATFVAAPATEPEWAAPVPLLLTLPCGDTVRMRLFWAHESAARFMLERLEAAPPRPAPHLPSAVAGAVLRCPVEIGGMRLSVREAKTLACGDVLLPEHWTPEAPRLRVSGGPTLACRLDNGALSVLGPDATAPTERGDSFAAREAAMTEAVAHQTSESPKTTASTAPTASDVSQGIQGGENAPTLPILDEAALAGLELPVTFELASLTLRVEELIALAPGHTFALGGDVASVPVFVRVGGRITARGRLVDVGGMPGVQITGTVPPTDGETPAQGGESA